LKGKVLTQFFWEATDIGGKSTLYKKVEKTDRKKRQRSEWKGYFRKFKGKSTGQDVGGRKKE